ncbi:uncharacterized protein BO66DRAFT_388941 [Aspergillus aculeatinus CBS 121060]|uniref:Uncharacterized protein n=1 Tax=Aspergillus aculeatinus CBS 121060 TaxID=1448322 RepID=A0ACD1HJ16_9EURO|nr:hypothetical protein BO66DRAFT_388941 [Aspergillus aculeatinus CBS 121060]RAH73348.1 hypothetical protein BO66DRAFT_388941 [Aspergillus aculeatinus CBS 121060]
MAYTVWLSCEVIANRPPPMTDRAWFVLTIVVVSSSARQTQVATTTSCNYHLPTGFPHRNFKPNPFLLVVVP